MGRFLAHSILAADVPYARGSGASGARRSSAIGRKRTREHRVPGSKPRPVVRKRRAGHSLLRERRPDSRQRRMIVAPPIEPMLAKIADEIPEGAFLYEP